jgi:hypothetical protein
MASARATNFSDGGLRRALDNDVQKLSASGLLPTVEAAAVLCRASIQDEDLTMVRRAVAVGAAVLQRESPGGVRGLGLQGFEGDGGGFDGLVLALACAAAKVGDEALLFALLKRRDVSGYVRRHIDA